MKRYLLSLAVLIAGLVSAGPIPVLQEVDVLVVGGTASAVESALAAQKVGAKVMVVAPRPYLGEEIAGHLALRLSPTANPQTPLAKRLYSYTVGLKNKQKAIEPTPLKVKRLFDEVLLAADIPFLTGAPATDLLVDEAGQIAGAVVANRSGRQAIIARCVIDATERGALARSAGVATIPFKEGTTVTVSRMIIAAEPPTSPNIKVEELPGPCGFVKPITNEKRMDCRLFRCTKDYTLKNLTPATLAELEQDMRDWTFTPQLLDSADCLSMVLPDCVIGSRQYLYCAGSYAAPNTVVARQMQEPALAMARAATLGKEAAEVALKRPAPRGVRTKPTKDSVTLLPNERICLAPDAIHVEHFAREKDRTVEDTSSLKDFGSYDVVVAGLGTAGAPAAISAARRNLSVLACDYLHTIGGVMTSGLIGYYWYGNRVGFTTEIDKGVEKTASVLAVGKAEWFRREIRKAGGTIWLGTMINGVVKQGNQITGVIVVTPDGQRGLVRTKMVIDATGNADLAAMSGEPTEFIGEREVSLQGTGLARRNLQTSYANSDIGFADETDAGDLALFALRTRLSIQYDWDVAQIVNSRERRRMRGVFYITPQDILLQRTYPDTIVQPMSNFDSHGQTDHDIFFLMDCGHKALVANFPYRAILPQQTDGLLVLGLGASAHRDAMPVLRMQPDLQNQGFAAGLVAEQVVRKGITPRQIDVRAVQHLLIEKGILSTNVLTETDSFPLSDAVLQASVKKAVLLPQDNRKERRDPTGRYGEPLTREEVNARREIYLAAAALFTDPTRAIPLLKAEFAQRTDRNQKLAAAELLAILGDATGAPLLIEELKSSAWDAGWNYRGMGQFGRSVSRLDGIIWSLARAQVKSAVPAIIEKVKQLEGESDYSHFRVTGLALSALGAKEAVPALAELLKKPTVAGHAMRFDKGLKRIPQYELNENKKADKERSDVLRELAVLTALYRLGDANGVAREGLLNYTKDPRGVYARFAEKVLREEVK